MKYIETGKKRSDAIRKWKIMVDDEDYEYLNQFYWTIQSEGIATTRGISGKHLQMHRVIMKAPFGSEIDHRDGNRLNNQRSNLRFCTSSQNKMNRGARSDNKSGHKGVSWHKQRGKWTARIMAGDKYKHLGLFPNIKDAVLAYNEAAKKYHKEFAYLPNYK